MSAMSVIYKDRESYSYTNAARVVITLFIWSVKT